MKKFLTVVAIIVTIAVSAMIGLGVYTACNYPEEREVHKATENGKPVIGEKLDITLPAEDDAEGQKVLAYQLYLTANANHKNIDSVATFINSVTTTMGIPVIGYRNYVKNNDRYFYSDYSFVDDEVGSVILGAFAEENTLYGTIAYTDATMDKVKAQKTLKPTYKIEDNKVWYNANWDKLFSTWEEDKPTSLKDVEGEYFVTDQNILPETIISAKVTYNAEQGYYTVYAELDTSNPKTTEKTLPNLRKSSEADDAHYTSMVETFEVWDNGYYKHFLSVDKWEGSRGILKLNSVIDFETTFLYDNVDVDIDNYQYASDYIAKLKGTK